MSFLVQINESAHRPDALDGFTPTAAFNMKNAQAMMWLSQLAYETPEKSKVESILGAWKMTLLAFRTNDPVTGLPPHSACVVVAGGRKATIISFSAPIRSRSRTG
jgi:hypothetical protein